MKKISQTSLNVAVAAAREDFRKAVRNSYESLCHLLSVHAMPRVNVCTNIGHSRHLDRYSPYEKVCLWAKTPLQLLRLGAACRVAGVKNITVLLEEDTSVMLYLAQAIGAIDIYVLGTAMDVLDMAERGEIDKIVCPCGVFSTQQEELLYKKGVDLTVLEREYLTIIVADDTVAEQWVAADILHILGCDDRHDVCLISTSEKYIKCVMTAMDSLRKFLPDDWGDMMMNLRTVYCPTDEDVVKTCDELRAMRVILSCRNNEKYAEQIKNAGSIFVNDGQAQAVYDMTGSVEPTVSVHHLPLTGVSGMDFIRKRHFHYSDDKNSDIWSSLLVLAENADCMKGESLALCMRMMSTASKNKI
ncbi:MAG: histidinol dehydrogenase [Flavobacteriales bacterium]|nr:histidinol dehydrogenase [Flavobacteriales bacterium]